jgi:YfiH family protein
MATPVLTEPFVLYQSPQLATYAKRLIHGFTGKPITLGGPGGPTEAIWETRHTLCRAAGLNEKRLVIPRQAHTDRFRINETPFEGDADAVILTEPGIAAFIQVADCVPIILYAPDRHAGDVIHAGWRGTAQTITQKTAAWLIENAQAAPEQLQAVIGPSIGGCCYEVSPEVSEAVGRTLQGQPESDYAVLQDNGKPRIDLKQVNRLQLNALGIRQVEILDACTRCETEHLWSYRRGDDGRQVAFLQLQP